MSNRIDLTQFEGHGFREAIAQNRHEYEEGFPPATVGTNIYEGITFTPPPLGERLVSWGGHKVWMSDKDANVIQHIDGLIAELKRCYEKLDNLKRLVTWDHTDSDKIANDDDLLYVLTWLLTSE